MSKENNHNKHKRKRDPSPFPLPSPKRLKIDNISESCAILYPTNDETKQQINTNCFELRKETTTVGADDVCDIHLTSIHDNHAQIKRTMKKYKNDEDPIAEIINSKLQGITVNGQQLDVHEIKELFESDRIVFIKCETKLSFRITKHIHTKSHRLRSYATSNNVNNVNTLNCSKCGLTQILDTNCNVNICPQCTNESFKNPSKAETKPEMKVLDDNQDNIISNHFQLLTNHPEIQKLAEKLFNKTGFDLFKVLRSISTTELSMHNVKPEYCSAIRTQFEKIHRCKSDNIQVSMSKPILNLSQQQCSQQSYRWLNTQQSLKCDEYIQDNHVFIQKQIDSIIRQKWQFNDRKYMPILLKSIADQLRCDKSTLTPTVDCFSDKDVLPVALREFVEVTPRFERVLFFET